MSEPADIEPNCTIKINGAERTLPVHRTFVAGDVIEYPDGSTLTIQVDGVYRVDGECRTQRVS